MFTNLTKITRKWWQKNEGVTAIEFSLLAVPFVTFVIGIIELSLMFMGNAVLNGAVADAVRMIRTGQVQTSDGDPEETFSNALCAAATIMLNCDDIQYEVIKLDDFSGADDQPELQFDDDGHIIKPPFDAGGVSDVVMVRVYYLYQLMTPLIGAFFSDYPGNKKLMETTAVIETEPYDFEDEN